MSPEMQRLHDLLSCVCNNGAQHSEVQIHENDPLATLKKVILKVNNGDWFAIEPDKGAIVRDRSNQKVATLMSPLLMVGGESKHHRACDALLFIKQNDRITALFMELKSSEDPSGYTDQLVSTSCFVDYLTGLARELYGITLPQIEKRFVLFHGAPSIRKRPTKNPAGQKATTDPRKPLRLPVHSGQQVYLNQLL